MTLLVESPWPAVLMCTVLLIICGVVFLRTGRTVVLGVMAGIVVALAAMVVLERTIVTETEEVEDTLHGIAENLAANDKAAVLASFVPGSPYQAQSRSALDRVTVESASVGADLKVVINKLTSPPTATTYFTGRIHASDNRGQIPYENYIRKFKVRLERHGDRWLIVDYEAADLRRKDF